MGFAAQVLVIQLPHPALIRTFGHLTSTDSTARHVSAEASEMRRKKSTKSRGETDPALLVQEIEQAQLSLYETDALLIVAELNPAPGQPLPNVLLLLQVEYVLQENAQQVT